MMAPSTATDGILSRPRTLTVMPTYTCPAACNQCGTLSHPGERSRQSIETILAGIRQAAELGFANVVFTGGEATLRWRDLLTAIRAAEELGLPTRLVTNAHWALDATQAATRVAALREAGLREINYSTGDEHARFIPVERVVLATQAALRAGLSLCIMVELRLERSVTKATLVEQLLRAGLSEAEVAAARIQESPWMPLDPGTRETYPADVAVDRNNLARQTGCDNVLQTYVMQADGRIGACCGLGMRLVPELSVARSDEEDFLAQAIERAEGDLLKLWLRYKGPEKILAWASEHDPSIDWEDRYGHKCQACLRVYQDPAVASVIREHYEKVVAEVLQTAWLDEQVLPRDLGTA